MRNKLKTKIIVMTFLMVMLSIISFGQTRTITGNVVDENGNPISGALVFNQSKTSSVFTDDNGNFKLQLKDGDAKVTVKLLGFETTTVSSSESSKITIQSTIKNLQDVVVIGYGTAKKKDLTGSIVSIQAKDFNPGQINSPEQLLTGKVAGAQINLGDGAPGSGGRIRIRGVGTVNGSANPLIVIDGVPVDDNTLNGSANVLNTINPNDIASFDVLKDASATAIYGARAANGVIIITMKKGIGTNKLRTGFNSTLSIFQPSKFVSNLTSSQFRDAIYAATTDSTKMALMGDANTDWQKEIFQTGVGINNNLNFTGGIKNLPYRLSLGQLNQEGILKTGTFNRYSAGLNLNPSFFDNHLKVDINAKATKTTNRFAATRAIGDAIAFDPTKPISGTGPGGGNYGGYWEWLDNNGNPSTLAPRNPLGVLMNREDRSKVNRLIGNVKFDYSFHFLPDLHAVLNVGMDNMTGKGTVVEPEYAATSWNRGGINNSYIQKRQNKLLDFYLNYVKTSGKNKFDLTGGYSYQKFTSQTPATNDYSYNGSIYQLKGVDPVPGYNVFLGFIARANYTYDNKLYVTLTDRYDASSKFAPSVRWQHFPSASVAYRLIDKASTGLSNLKLRAGWGVTGNANVGADYNYLPLYIPSTSGASYQFGSTYYQTNRPNGYDMNFKWETISTANLGIDFGLNNNKINGAIELYNRVTTGLLNKIPVPVGSNLTNELLTNVGQMTNKGVELILNFKPINSSTLSWNVNTNFAYNVNTIDKLLNNTDTNFVGNLVGNISGGSGNTIQIMAPGYSINTFYVRQQVYNQDGTPIQGLYVDKNGDGIINGNDRYYYKSSEPRLIMAMTNSFAFRNFVFSFLLRSQIGNYIYNNVASDRGTSRNLIDPLGFLGNVQSDYLNTSFTNNQYESDYYISNASFLKLDNINLSYNLGKIDQHGTELSLNFGIQNVFTLTTYKGIDPEISGGIDNNFYPRARTWTMGANIQF